LLINAGTWPSVFCAAHAIDFLHKGINGKMKKTNSSSLSTLDRMHHTLLNRVWPTEGFAQAVMQAYIIAEGKKLIFGSTRQHW
jgi:hypothetical protein